LRELKFLWEEQQEAWADELSGFLLESLQRRKRAGAPDEKAFKKILARYHAILAKGRLHHPGNQGAPSKAANLLDRLEDYDLSVLACLCDPEVPFTNNQGERDIRMEKVRQKISGCFRTLHGARVFARIRGYISTCRKQGRNLLEELENAILGNPFIPSLPNRAP
jgi:transposase